MNGQDRVVAVPVELAALLFVKAHSARVPGKNFRPLGGVPLFQWIISTLRSLNEVSSIVIDTDAAPQLRAAGLVEDQRLVLRDRPAELRGDHVTANALIGSLLAEVPARVYLSTHVTNPFLGRDTIRAAIARFREVYASGKADSLVAVNVHRARFFDAAGRALNHDPRHLLPTQALEPLYEENSNLYLFDSASFERTGSRIGERPLFFPTRRHESLDIDEPEDFLLAERIAAGMKTTG